MSRISNLIRLSNFKLTIVLIVSLAVLVFGVGLLFLRANPSLYGALKAKFLKQEISFLEISLKDGHVLANLFVTKKDQTGANNFFTKLGVQKEDLRNVSFDFDEQTEQKLTDFLPMHTEVFFSSDGSQLRFATPLSVSFASALGLKDYTFATGFGVAHYKTDGKRVHKLEVLEPKLVLENATSSGQLYLAKRLEPLLPYLSKIATIKVEVDGRNVGGEITLK